MKKKKEKKIIYFSDELNNDFAGTNIKTCRIDESFKYIHNGFLWRIISWILYYVIAFPIVFVYERIILGVKFVNNGELKKYKRRGCYLYGNHTGFYDAFTPNLVAFPHRNNILVGADTVSIKGLRNIVQMMGAVPLADGYEAKKNFLGCLEHLNERGENVTVYPEAHIWHYYNGVRPFGDGSFYYPVKFGAPVFAFFTVYTKPKGFLSCFRHANMTVYVSDPIFPKEGLSAQEQMKDLRDKVYAFMVEKSKLSDYEVIKYVRKDENK